MVPFESVSFVVSRSAMEAVEAALALEPHDRGFGPLAEVLGAVWTEHRARRDQVTVPFDAERRFALLDALSSVPELRGRLAAAPDVVRAAMLAEVGRHSARLAALVRLVAPSVVLGATRAVLAQAIDGLDPRNELSFEEPPPVPETDDDGRISPNVHAWLELVLEHAREADSVQVTQHVAAEPAEVTPDKRMRPGIESTCFGMRPLHAWWMPRAIRLPRQVDQGRIVAGFAGGPVSWGSGDDPAPSGVETALARRLSQLRADQALVSFLAMETGVDVPWADR